VADLDRDESAGPRPPLTGKGRAALRAEAHHLDPVVHIGQHGITDAVTQSLDDALRAKQLVKIQVGKNADVSVKDVAPMLAQRLKAEVIQVIGRTATLYRRKAKSEGKREDRRKGEGAREEG
jgi:RNA-binding protein